MLIDIIFHDAWVICISRTVHIAFGIGMKWNITLHMDGDIT